MLVRARSPQKIIKSSPVCARRRTRFDSPALPTAPHICRLRVVVEQSYRRAKNARAPPVVFGAIYHSVQGTMLRTLVLLAVVALGAQAFSAGTTAAVCAGCCKKGACPALGSKACFRCRLSRRPALSDISPACQSECSACKCNWVSLLLCLESSAT